MMDPEPQNGTNGAAKMIGGPILQVCLELCLRARGKRNQEEEDNWAKGAWEAKEAKGANPDGPQPHSREIVSIAARPAIGRTSAQSWTQKWIGNERA